MLSVNDIVTFEDDKKYAVLSKVLLDNKNYYYLIQVNEEENDFIEDVLIVKDGDDDSVDVVEDEEETARVKPIIMESLKVNFPQFFEEGKEEN